MDLKTQFIRVISIQIQKKDHNYLVLLRLKQKKPQYTPNTNLEMILQQLIENAHKSLTLNC
jgi:hypothetical protein